MTHPLGPSDTAYAGQWAPTTRVVNGKRLWRSLGTGDVAWHPVGTEPQGAISLTTLPKDN